MLTNFLFNFIKTISITLCISFTTFKIKNYKCDTKKKNILIILLNIAIALSYAVIYNTFSEYEISSITNLLCYILYSLIFTYIIKVPYSKGLILSIISITATFLSKSLAILINFNLIKLNLLKNDILEITSLAIIQFVLLYLFFQIKRFKKGISFLKEEVDYKKSDKIGWVTSILIIFACTVNSAIEAYSVRTFIILIIGCGGLLMVAWIRKNITKNYKEKMKDRTVEMQAKQLKEKDEIIDSLKGELENVLKINHKYNHRLSAMETAVSKLGNRMKFNEEFASEYSDILDSISELSKQYKSEISVIDSELPKTNVYSIDNILEYMKKEANKEGIKLDLKIKGSINYMVENIVSKSRLEILIGDHIKDAIIAISSNESCNKNILVIIGMINKYYELQIYDTGLEFEIKTLLKLGKESITTHKETGGSGIGFMTTFETMKECKASLIIEEKHPISDNDYTKSVIIRFDGKNEYRIHSYRAEEIKIQSNDDRIIIEKL